MSLLLAVATVLSTQIPEAALERTLGPIQRADHFTGTWRVRIDGVELFGNRVVVDTEVTTTPFGTGRWMHFVGGLGYCAIAAEEPIFLYCKNRDRQLSDLQLPDDGFAITSRAFDVTIDRPTKNGVQHVGTLHTALVQAAKPSALDAYDLYEQVRGQRLEKAIGATFASTRGVRLVMRYAIGTPIASRVTKTHIIELEATLDFWYAARPTITVRETARYTEVCHPAALGAPARCARE